MELKIFTDGGALHNPGPAASAFVVFLNGKLIHQSAVAIGSNTNNFAEYTALINALNWLVKNLPQDAEKVQIFSDSNLMVNQVNGLFKIKNTVIRNFIVKVRELERQINLPVVYRHIPREQNSQADALVKKALAEKI